MAGQGAGAMRHVPGHTTRRYLLVPPRHEFRCHGIGLELEQGSRRASTAPAGPPPPGDGPLRGRLQRPRRRHPRRVSHALLPGSLRGARIPDQEVQGAAPGEGARSPKRELQHIRRRGYTEPDGRQEGEDPGADSDGHRRGQPLPGRGGEASRPRLLPDTGGVRVGGQSSDQGHLRQGGGHGGLVGGLALDRPRGGAEIAGQDPPGDQTTLHSLRHQGHRGGCPLRRRLLRGRRGQTQGGTRAGRSLSDPTPEGGERLGLRPPDRRPGLLRPWGRADVVCKLFATRKAYICMLEILAQLIAFVTFGARLPAAIIAFIDNTAGQAALTLRQGRRGQRHDRGLLVDGGAPGMARRVRAGPVQGQRRRRSLQGRLRQSAGGRVDPSSRSHRRHPADLRGGGGRLGVRHHRRGG